MIALDDSKIRQASTLFSNSFFREVIEQRDLSRLRKHASLYVGSAESSEYTFYDLIQSTYHSCEWNYRFEYLYKNKLLNNLLFEKYRGTDTVVIAEMQIAKAIGDLVLINGEAVLYEIKTELDRTSRLESQIINYYKCFDQLNIVTHETLYTQYERFAESTGAGVVVYTYDHQLEQVKKPVKIAEYLCSKELFRLLWKQEVEQLAKSFGFDTPVIPNTRHFKHYLELLSSVPVLDFQRAVFETLKSRALEKRSYQTLCDVPDEIRLICNCLNLDRESSAFLHKLLKQPILY